MSAPLSPTAAGLSPGARCELAHLVRMGRACPVTYGEDRVTFAEQAELVAAGLAVLVRPSWPKAEHLVPTEAGRRTMAELAAADHFLAHLAARTAVPGTVSTHPLRFEWPPLFDEADVLALEVEHG